MKKQKTEEENKDNTKARRWLFSKCTAKSIELFNSCSLCAALVLFVSVGCLFSILFVWKVHSGLCVTSQSWLFYVWFSLPLKFHKGNVQLFAEEYRGIITLHVHVFMCISKHMHSFLHTRCWHLLTSPAVLSKCWNIAPVQHSWKVK